MYKNTIEDFFKAGTDTLLNSYNRGYKIYYVLAPEFATQAVAEDADGKQELIDVGNKDWEDFEEFITVVIEEYELTDAERALQRLEEYEGDNKWEDIFEVIGFDEEASEKCYGWDSSSAVVFNDGTGIEFNERNQCWEIMDE